MDKKRRIIFEGEAGVLLKRLNYETWPQVPKLMSAYVFELWCFLGRQGRMRRLSKMLGLSQKSKLEKEWKINHEQ